MNIILINGTVTGEKPKVLLKEIEHYLNEGNYSYDVEQLSLDQLTLELADGRSKEKYNEDTQEAIAKMEAAGWLYYCYVDFPRINPRLF